MAAYCWAYDYHQRADCLDSGSAPAPMLVSIMGLLELYNIELGLALVGTVWLSENGAGGCGGDSQDRSSICDVCKNIAQLKQRNLVLVNYNELIKQTTDGMYIKSHICEQSVK